MNNIFQIQLDQLQNINIGMSYLLIVCIFAIVIPLVTLSIISNYKPKWWNCTPFKEIVTIVVAIVLALYTMKIESGRVNKEIKDIYTQMEVVAKENNYVQVDAYTKNGQPIKVWAKKE